MPKPTPAEILVDPRGALVRRIADNVEPVLLTESGHFVPEENPKELIRIIQGFMQKLATN